ncbi:MAG: hypothetical protein RMJ98_12210 [Myxococcales bacterium]|nr:hypothetical protein [Polyangiaceae bacterium]MDW8250051.1 hypothetical protein [Myxococcales bacterium]
MPRLLLLDDDGRLALLAAGMLAVEGAPGFSEAIPCSLGEPSSDPLPTAVLGEIGLLLPPPVRSLASLPRQPNDILVSLGGTPHPDARLHLPCPPLSDDAPPLVRRASARFARDRLAHALQGALASLSLTQG